MSYSLLSQSEKEVPLSTATGNRYYNGELMDEYFPKHSRMGATRIK